MYESHHKIRVGVLRGGPSSEYDVSLKTGDTVLRNLSRDIYIPHDIYISKEGVWHYDGFEKTPAEALKLVDVVFVALHGEYGEDGKVQSVLEHLKVPFVGSTSVESAIAMNKHLTKKMLHGMKHAKLASHKVISKEEYSSETAQEIFRTIPHPAIVKPVSLGSSVGVKIVRTFSDLEAALAEVFTISEKVMVEEYIEGREATCGIIDDFRDEKHYALPPVEILPSNTFFDYDAKYGGNSRELCPSTFSDEIKKQIEDAAREAHMVLGLRHYSRSDFMVHPKRGVFYLETNTLPGLTSESLLPKEIYAVGGTLPQFLDHVIRLALGER